MTFRFDTTPAMRITLKTALKALEAAALAEKRQKARDRTARWRANKKASQSVTPPTQRASQSVTHHGKDEVFRGITWRDVPGRDEAARKMRFSLLRRGDWRGYKSCQFLEGDALKAAFAKITESQKAKSHKAATLRTEAAQKRNESQAS